MAFTRAQRVLSYHLEYSVEGDRKTQVKDQRDGITVVVVIVVSICNVSLFIALRAIISIYTL